LLFLDQNPELKKAAMDAGEFSLPGESLHFEFKDELLKKEIAHDTIDEFLVAELENDLLAHEQNELSLFLASNPRYQHDRKLFAATKLRPDLSMQYPDKRGLKRGALVPFWIRYGSVAAAACVFFALGIWFYNQPDTLASNQTDTKDYSNNLKEPVKTDENPGSMEAITKNTGSLVVPAIIPAVAIASNKKNKIEPIPVAKNNTENFKTYSKNRQPDDYLEALVNAYIPTQRTILSPKTTEEPEVKTNPNRITDNPLNGFASKSLERLIKDSALTNEIENSKYTVKTKIAKALAWATDKASNGKVKVEAIPYNDGSLAAMSFTNGRYNWVKKF
jgi:hypothetical protein